MKTREEIEAEAKRIISEYERYLQSSYIRMLRRFRKEVEKAGRQNHRRILVVSGSDPVELGVSVGRALHYFSLAYRKVRGGVPHVLYVYHDEFEEAKLIKEIVKKMSKVARKKLKVQVTRYEESEKFLGTTFSGLVLDLTKDLKPNDVGRLVEIVEGGGIVLLITPPWRLWDNMKTLFKLGLTVPRHPEPRHVFISWFKRKLLEAEGIFIYDLDEARVLKETGHEASEASKRRIRIPGKRVFPEELYRLALTQDQVNAIRLFEELIEKPGKGKRKTLVLTADRGRGKSCAVGIGLVGLISQLRHYKHKVRVIVTAPSPLSIQSLMNLALKAAETLGLNAKPIKRGGNIIEIQGNGFSIEYWEPLVATRLSGDVLAVDEASGMPIPILQKLWRKYRRSVFATTIHGYEGAGRGFSVRFLSSIESDPKTHLYKYEMHEPIRYAPGDPVERWLFNALLLDAEPAELEEEDIQAIKRGEMEYIAFDPEWLFSKEGENTLRQLFGIYVLAHYRNQPDDLGMLADAPHHMVRAIRLPSGAIVCAAQIAEEGGLDEETIDDLLRGGKIPGNIIPDRLLKHLRIRDFGRKLGLRIVRIATHPKVQGMGIGSRMLEEIYREAAERGYDWVGSGFGVTEKLLRFWLKNGFKPLHLSPDRNPVSGEYTILVIKPVTQELVGMVSRSSKEFRLKLVNSLHDTYRDLELDVALQILREHEPIDASYAPQLSEIQRDRLWIYVYGPMTYEAACDVVYELARAYWIAYPRVRNLSKKEEAMLVAKALQSKPWGEVASELGMRQYDVMRGIKEIARKLGLYYYGDLMDRDRRPGIEWHETAATGMD